MGGNLKIDTEAITGMGDVLRAVGILIGSSSQIGVTSSGDPRLDEVIARFSRSCGEFGDGAARVLSVRADSAFQIADFFRNLERDLAVAARFLSPLMVTGMRP